MIYKVSTDLSAMDFEMIFEFLSNSYWAEGMPRTVLREALKNSLCFGLFADNKQIGFARLITDRATFAYLADVFILPAARSNGLSRILLDEIMAHPATQGLRRIMLATSDAHGLYAKYGFRPINDASSLMQAHNPDVYKLEKKSDKV